MSEWKKVKLGECCEITSAKRCHASERSREGVPFYCSKEIIQLDKETGKDTNWTNKFDIKIDGQKITATLKDNYLKDKNFYGTINDEQKIQSYSD